MPEIDNESRKWLYQTLTSPEYGLNLGTPQEFDSLMTNNEESRKWLWEQANSFGLNVGADYDEFSSLVNPAPQRVDVAEVQQAEQANVPVSEVATQPQQEAIPTATMEQVDNAGHYQPRSGAELKTPEQLEAEAQQMNPYREKPKSYAPPEVPVDTEIMDDEIRKSRERLGLSNDWGAAPFGRDKNGKPIQWNPKYPDGTKPIVQLNDDGTKEYNFSPESVAEMNNLGKYIAYQSQELAPEIAEVARKKALDPKYQVPAELKAKIDEINKATKFYDEYEKAYNQSPFHEINEQIALKESDEMLAELKGRQIASWSDAFAKTVGSGIMLQTSQEIAPSPLDYVFGKKFHDDMEKQSEEMRQKGEEQLGKASLLMMTAQELEQAKNTIRLSQKNQDGAGYYPRQLWNGVIYSNLTDLDQISSMSGALGLAKIAEKLDENGQPKEPLTEEEQMAYDALIFNSAVQQRFGGNVTMFNRIGQSMPENTAFVLDFVIGSHMGAQSVGTAVSDITKKGIQKAVKKQVKNGALRFTLDKALPTLTNMGAQATYRTMLDMPFVYSDATKRNVGSMAVDPETMQAYGFVGGKDSAAAMSDAWWARFIENGSESLGDMVFEPGVGMVWRRVKDTKGGIRLQQARKWFGELGNGRIDDALTTARRFNERHGTGFQFGYETAEEFAGGTANALFVGDQELKDVYSSENMMETALNCFIFGVAQASTINGVKSGLVDLPNDIRIRSAKREAASVIRDMDNISISELDRHINEDSSNELADWLYSMNNEGNWNEQQRKAVMAYTQSSIMQKAKHQMRQTKMRDDIEKSDAEVDAMVNDKSGDVILVTFNQGDETQQGTVIRGRVSAMEEHTEDGGLSYRYNPNLSSVTLAVRLPDGTVKMVGSRSITSVDAIDDAESLKERRRGEIVSDVEKEVKTATQTPSISQLLGGFDFTKTGGVLTLQGQAYRYDGRDDNGYYTFTPIDKDGVADEKQKTWVSEKNLRKMALLELLNTAIANNESEDEIDGIVEELESEERVENIEKSKDEANIWAEVSKFLGGYVTLNEEGDFDPEKSDAVGAAGYLVSLKQGDIEAAAALVDERINELQTRLSEKPDETQNNGEGVVGMAVNSNAASAMEEQTANAIAFLEQVRSNLSVMQQEKAVLDEEKVVNTPVSQMEVGQQFPVEWRGQQAIATVMGKDADGRSVVTVRDMNGDDIEAGIDDMSDADWEAVRVQPQQPEPPMESADNGTEQVQSESQPQTQEEVSQPAPQQTPTPAQPEPAPIPTTSDVQPSIEIPRDKEGNAEYDKITDPYVYAAAVTEEFGDEAIDVVNALIESEEAALEGAKKIKDTIKRFREQRESKARLDLFNKVKDILTPQEQTETPAEETTPVEEAPVEQPTAETPVEEAPVEETPVEETPAEETPEQPTEIVPDWTEDTAKSARERGYRMVDGERVDRQEPIDGVEGNEVEVKFSDTEKPKGVWKVVEAESLQPSHRNKKRNPRFFITEAQPKERKDNASDEASTKIAKDINPEEVMQGVTAYSGSPVINSRGEVIQGNNRTIGLQKMYESYPESQEKYKQALMDKAEQMGLDKEAIGKMQHPVLVRSVDVDDDTAIKLGQKTSQDTESGGKQRMGASQVRNGLGDKYANLIEMLFADTTEDEGIGEAIARNGVTALKYLWNQKVINNTQYQSALENGDLTAEAKEDFRNIIMESLFEGGPDGLRTAFNMLPAKSQNAILQTIYRDAKSNDESKIKGEVQQAIMAFANLMGFKSFAAAKNQTDVENAVNSWLGQQNMFSDVANTEKYSNFALELAKRFKWQTLTGQRAFFNELYDKLQGVASEGLSMFEEVQQLGLAEAIKAVYGIDYLKPQQNNGISGSNVVADDNGTRQEGEQGGTGETESGERAESGERPADDRGGDERTGREGQEDKGREITIDEIRNAWENGFDGVDEETLDAYYQWLLKNANNEESNRILDDMNDLLGIEDEAEEEEESTEETPTSEEPAPKQEKKTKEQLEQERRDDILSLKDPLTEEEIRNSSEDEIIKENALSYLNGDRGVMAANCYLIIYDNVRNVTTGAERSSGTTDQTQLDAEDNGDKEPGESGQGGRGTGELGGEPSDTGRQGNGQKDNNGGVADTDGEGGLQEVEGNKPQKSNNQSSNPSRRGGSRGNRGASVDGNGGREVGREDSNANADDGGENARDSLQDALDEFGDLLNDLTKENQAIRRRNQGILYANPIGANMSMEKLKIWAKLTVAGAKIGYELIKKGITKFADWSKQMNTLLSAKLTNAFGWDKDGVDQYILELWNSKLPIDGETHTVAEWASIMGKKKIREAISESREVKAEKQAKVENIEAKPADIDNINATLPFLLPEQRDDVLKAETQFFTEAHQDREHGYGKGYLFTNGTGTGKTYTGLGIIKRFVKMGKGRVLLVVPSEKKESDWINSGKNLLLDIHSLRDDKYWNDGKSSTQRSGSGIVVTTDAAFRENFELLKDNFDLVVYDESHRIMSSNDANSTRYLDHHFMLTLKDAEAATQRAIAVSPEMEEHRANAKELDTIRKALAKNERLKAKIESGNGTQSDLDKLLSEQEENDLMHRAQQLDFRNASIIADIEARKSEFEQKGKAFMDAKQPKVVFLSATPFNTVDSMKYAEGYIFSYPEGDKNGELFKTQYFPSSFQSRHGKVQQSVVDAVQAEREEINFSERLQHELETMSGRIIENGYDYSRHFPTLTNEYATMFNEAVQRITSFQGYQPLYKAMYDTFLKGAGFAPALLETLKVALVIPRIKQHIAMGRKVVVFHRRRNSQEPPSPPFERMLNKAMMEATTPQERAAVKSAVDQFRKEFSQLLAYEQTLNYDMILKQFSDEFGNEVAFFNGDVKETEQENSEEEKKNISSIDAFNQHNGKTKIIVVQEASGKEGIDLHDTFGDEMRVEINLSLPQNPLTMLQIMGRIFRIGQKSNAVFEYPLIGLDFELMTFGSNMNQAVGTAENLALGDLSRGLRQALANGVLEHSGEVPLEGQGVGGVEYDRRSQEEGSYEKAMSDYYKAKAQKFPDTNATPEALGYKMVEWAGLGESDEVLEPSAGHGAIARYVPQGNSLTAIEPNISLMAGLQLRASGRTRDFKNQTFEALDIINKYNVVLMNSQHQGQSRGSADIVKAYQHLREGGRMVVVANEESVAMAKSKMPNAVLVGKVKLPSFTFGDNVADENGKVVNDYSKASVYIFDIASRNETREEAKKKYKEVDLSDAKNIGELFAKLKDVKMPDRTIDDAAIDTLNAGKTWPRFKKLTRVFWEEQSMFSDTAMRVLARTVGKKAYRYTKKLDIEYKALRNNPRQAIRLYQEFKDSFNDYDNMAREYAEQEARGEKVNKQRVEWTGEMADFCELSMRTILNVMRVNSEEQLIRLAEEHEANRARQLNETVQKMKENISQIASTVLNNAAKDSGIRPYIQDYLEAKDDYSRRSMRNSLTYQLKRAIFGELRANYLEPNGYIWGDIDRVSSEEIQSVLEQEVDDYINRIDNGFDPLNVKESISDFEKEKEYDIEDIRQYFYNLIGDNKDLRTLFDKVVKVSSMFGYKFKFTDMLDKQPSVQGDTNFTGLIRLKDSLFRQGADKTKQANVILHEMIHSSLIYATLIRTYDKAKYPTLGLFMDNLAQRMSPEMNEAVDELLSLFNTLKIDKRFTRRDGGLEDYGAFTPDEMIAELANPMFRAKLKAKRVWKKVVNAIAKFFGAQTKEAEESDALVELEKILDKFLNNADKSLYNDVKNMLQLGGYANESLRYEDNGSDELYRDQEREYKAGEMLPITKGKDGYRVEGLNDSYPSVDRLLDAWRDNHPDYFAEVRNGQLYVEPLNLGEGRTAKERRRNQATAERQWRRAHERANDTIKKLGLQDRVTILDSTDGLTGKRKKAKGWFDPKTGKIVIVMPNHNSPRDVVKTILHEGVAHYGLRKLVGNDNMNEFLDKVFEHASKDVRDRIIDLAMNKYNRNVRKATEEYLAGLAEDTNFEDATEKDWFKKIKGWFMQLLHKIGIDFGNINEALDYASYLTDNELRYILWKSYRNLVADAESRTEIARDAMMQSQLGVGNYAPQTVAAESMASEDNDVLLREGDTYEGSHIRVPGVKPSDVPHGYDEDGDYFIRWHKIIDPKIYAQATLDWASEGYISKDDIRIIDDAIADIDNEIKEHEERWARLDKEETKGLMKQIDRNSKMRYHERKLKMLKKAKEILNSLKSNNNPTNPQQPNNQTPTPPTPTPPSNPNPPTPPAQPQQPNNPVGRNGRNMIADEYNRETGANVSGVNGVKRGWEKFARDMFDGLRPLEQMQKLIEKALGRKLRDSEKAYELATQLTSKTGQQIDREQLSHMVPVLQQVTDVIKALKDADGYSRDEAYDKVTNYMLAKHGLERNEWFEKQGKDEGDYSGLRGLAERLGYNPDDYKTAAEATVKDMEDTMKAAGIDVNEFWKTVNALTNRMLEISYESGMIDKDTFEDLKKRHKYYVPLRGFAEGTAADLFDYVTQSPQFQNIFKKAKGRQSMADDPLANLMSMLHSAIVIGNQNQVMQKIYNLAVNSNSDLLRVTKPWYVYNDATKTWEEKYPDIPEDATADEIDAIVKQFDADMAQLKANGKAKRKYNRIDVGKKLLRYQAKEHEMVAYIDGQRVLMHVAGNPLVAQSMNRMNTQQLNKVMQGIQAITRWYSAINTSWSPAFGPKNAARDIRMMLFGAYTTGGIKKMWQSTRDIVKAGWALPRLLITGKMDGGLVKALGKQKAAQLEQWWNEFLDNGGETGFTRTLNAEKAKGEVKDMIRHMLNGSKDGENRVRKYTIGLIEWIGRYSEDISRFAAYCQQRAQGESVLSSIQEAKNVTVNFNVKGGGDLAANMRAMYSFFNASMQGINRMRRLATEHPGRFSAGIAAMMLGGAVLPWLNMAMFAMLGGDDDDWRKYEELTEYTANHNMILYVGNHKFISIPWSQELAPFNALGNIWFRQQMGWNKGRSVAEQWGDMFVDLSPVSVASGNKPGVGLVKTVMPSFTTPIWESLFNEDFTGSPLYKDNQWNKYDAAWEKAYAGKTSQSVIDASRWLNEKTGVDINPAIAEHLFSGVLGGMGRSGDKLLRYFTNGFQLQDAPFIRTMMFDSKKQGYIGAVQREYGRNAYDVLPNVKHDVDDMDAMEFAQFSQTEEFEIANLVSVYKTGKDLAGNKKGIVGIDAMEKEYKKIAGASDGSEEYREQLEEIRSTITERKMEMLDEIQQIKYKHSGDLRKRIIDRVNEVEQKSKAKME